jgi:hypothetical protein
LHLSQLRVANDTGTRFFEYLVEQGANKGECERHVNDDYATRKPYGTRPAVPNRYNSSGNAEKFAMMTRRLEEWDAKKKQYDADNGDYQKHEVDCGVDGYFMYKEVPDAADASTLADDYLTQPLRVTIDRGEASELVTLKTLNQTVPRIPEGTNDRARRDDFAATNPIWVRDWFAKSCNRGGGLGSISWAGYGEELAGATDWYYLYDRPGLDVKGRPERQTGHLFLQLLDSVDMKRGNHMPTAGALAGRYLYIGLVCAQGNGLGKHLMSIAYAASRALGCTGILLATMTNSAGFYYSQGFHFMNKVTGEEIDLIKYTVEKEVNGRRKSMLQVNYDPDDPDDPDNPDNSGGQKRDADDAALAQARRRASSYYNDNKRPRRSSRARLSYFV